jgi:hypothetical protein
MAAQRSWSVVLVFLVAACRASDTTPRPVLDAGDDAPPGVDVDAAPDATPGVQIDAPAPDAAIDAALDAATDASRDATIDARRAGQFRTVGALAQARLDHAAALLLDGRVLIVGGDTPAGSWTASAEVFDPATETFSPVASTTLVHAYPRATRLADGRVLLTGSAQTPSGPAPRTEIFDPATNAWTAGPDTLALHGWHVATGLADGRVLVTSETCEAYVAAGGTFQPLPPPNVLGPGHSGARLASHRVLLTGGPHQGSSGGGTRDDAEELDPTTGTFTTTGSMATARAAHTVTALVDGRALVTGGYIGLGGAVEVHASAELYDPATRTFSTAGAMALSRERHTATLLADGTVLVAGGASDGTGTAPDNEFFVTDTAAIFSPSARTFVSAATTMAVARERHTATRLTDGRVLLVGGSTSPVAELYEP